VEVNQATIDSLDHLRPYPADGTYIRAVDDGAIYRVAGGAPLYINDCTYLAGCADFVNINLQTVVDRDHLRSTPVDGTLLQGRPSDAYWEIVGGCRRPGAAAPGAIQVTDNAVNRFPLC
jgi:hypothetical protein